jgi:hypothetical protein
MMPFVLLSLLMIVLVRLAAAAVPLAEPNAPVVEPAAAAAAGGLWASEVLGWTDCADCDERDCVSQE